MTIDTDKLRDKLYGLKDWQEPITIATGCVRALLDELDRLRAAVKPVDVPVAWWNGEHYGQRLEPIGEPSFSAKENTWHDIPLYSGVNPYTLNAAHLAGYRLAQEQAAQIRNSRRYMILRPGEPCASVRVSAMKEADESYAKAIRALQPPAEWRE